MLQIKWNSNAIREIGWGKDNFDWEVNKSLIKELFLYSKLWFPNIKSSTSYINQSPVFEVKAWGVPQRKPGLITPATDFDLISDILITKNHYAISPIWRKYCLKLVKQSQSKVCDSAAIELTL